MSNKNFSNKRFKQRKSKRKLFITRFLLFIILGFICIIIYNNYAKLIFASASNASGEGNLSSSKSKTSEYPVIKLDQNSNYPGIGQKNVSNKDGYFTTFTTSGSSPKTYKEYKQNGTSSWANSNYWDGTMETTGCGITAMSIILSGYNKDYSPEDLRKRYYPVLNGDNISKELSNTFGVTNTDFFYDSVHLSENNIIKHLKTNKPVLICVWNKPKANRWTTASHYMVLLACDDNKMVYVSNPNRSWG